MYLYPEISDETPICTVATWPSIEYSIQIQSVLLNVNIVNIHFISTLTFPLKLQSAP
jgi:hypothetical protein